MPLFHAPNTRGSIHHGQRQFWGPGHTCLASFGKRLLTLRHWVSRERHRKTTRVFLSSSGSKGRNGPKAAVPCMRRDFQPCQKAWGQVLKDQKGFWLFLSTHRPTWWLAEALCPLRADSSGFQPPPTSQTLVPPTPPPTPHPTQPPGTNDEARPSLPLPVSSQKHGPSFPAQECGCPPPSTDSEI